MFPNFRLGVKGTSERGTGSGGSGHRWLRVPNGLGLCQGSPQQDLSLQRRAGSEGPQAWQGQEQPGTAVLINCSPSNSRS